MIDLSEVDVFVWMDKFLLIIATSLPYVRSTALGLGF